MTRHSPSSSIRRLLLYIPLLASSLIGTGCQTTVGSYLGNRGRDFEECFRVLGGLGLGLGADVKVAGLAHVSVLGFKYMPIGSIGWVYGPPPLEQRSLTRGRLPDWIPGLAIYSDRRNVYSDANPEVVESLA